MQHGLVQEGDLVHDLLAGGGIDLYGLVRILVGQVPLLQVGEGHAQPEGRVAELVGDAQLRLEGQLLLLVGEGRALHPDVAQQRAHRKTKCLLVEHPAEVHRPGRAVVGVVLCGDELEVGPHLEQTVDGPRGSDLEDVLTGRERAELLPGLVGALEGAVVHELHGAAERGGDAVEVVRVAAVADVDVLEIRQVAQRQLPAHRGVQQRRVVERQVQVVVQHGDGMPAQRRQPGGAGDVQHSEGGPATQLGAQAGERKEDEQDGRDAVHAEHGFGTQDSGR